MSDQPTEPIEPLMTASSLCGDHIDRIVEVELSDGILSGHLVEVAHDADYLVRMDGVRRRAVRKKVHVKMASGGRASVPADAKVRLLDAG